MAIHSDGTMDVMVGDVMERRRYSVNSIEGHFNCAGDYRLFPSAYEPEHDPENEIVMYFLGSIPQIVRR